VTVTAAVPRNDGAVLTYARTQASAAGRLETALQAHEAIGDVVVLDGDASRFQFIADGPTPRTVVAEHGGSVTDQRVTPEGTTVTAHFPRGTNFDPVLNALEARFGAVRVEQYADVGDTESTDDPLAGLTDRQREVLTAAYRAGYFEYPREQSASDVADQLDVSRPTFQEVLRAAERNLFAETLDGSETGKPQGEKSVERGQ
jgi:predicted DNA binding protein